MKANLLEDSSTEWNRMYGQAGHKPSTGVIRSVKAEAKRDPSVRRGGATVAGGGSSYNVKTIESSAQTASNKQEEITKAYTKEYAEDGSRGVQYAKRLKSRRKYIPSKGKRAIATAYTTAKTAKAAAATYGIWSWAIWVWLWLQLPFAILSIVFFGIYGVLDNLFYTISATADEKGMISIVTDGIAELIRFTAQVANEFTKLFGFNFNELNPANFFMVTHMLVMVIGWFTLFTAVFIYSLSMTHSIFGKKSGTKIATFLLAIIGYSIPLLNLFPWFFLWTIVVVKNPK